MLKNVMLIKGKNFGNEISNINVYLDEKTGLRSYKLSVWKLNDTDIEVIISGGRKGSYNLRVELKDIGNADITSDELKTFNYETKVTKIEPKVASL